jgi:ABC-type uncharacterized transport system substrate-binding protein
MRIHTVILSLVASLATGAQLNAEVTQTDLQIVARALSFMQEPPTGAVRVGILYSPSTTLSREQAENVQRMLGNGLKVGSVELKPVLVQLADAATAKVDIFLLTENVEKAEAEAAGIRGTKHPCVTTDMSKVQSGICLMGVRTQPRVQIVVNRAAAAASGVTFATVFRVMITEI